MWREWSSSQRSWGLAPAFSPTEAGDLLEAGAKPEASLSAEHGHSVGPLGQKPRGRLGELHSVPTSPGFPAAGIRHITTGQGCARTC